MSFSRLKNLLIHGFFFFCILSPLSSADAAWHSAARGIMGTEISLTYWQQDPVLAKEIEAKVFADMEGINQRLSPYISDSNLSKMNDQAGKQDWPIDLELQRLLDKSLYWGHATQGAFDVTFASLGWYYDYRAGKKPSTEQLGALLPAINYRLVSLDKSRGVVRYLHPNIRIDLGGIAKGYAVDRAIEILQSYGVKHATVSAGGDSRVLGDRRGQPWLIGIKNPRESKQQKSVAITLPLSDIAVSTSGDYERYFIDEETGDRIHHILNPKTGRSASEVMSVTVIGPLGIDTDPLSTSVFVLGVKQGLALVNQLAAFDCIIIDATGRVHYSDGLVDPQR